MKNFILICIFSIGLFLALPQTSSGSGTAPPDQVSFVADIQQAAPAIDVQTIVFTASPAYSFEPAQAPPVDLADNVVQEIPDFRIFDRTNYRPCLSVQVRSQNLAGNLNWGVFRIRSDTSV